MHDPKNRRAAAIVELGLAELGITVGGDALLITVAASEIAAAYDSEAAAVVVPQIAPGDCCLLWIVLADTLDGDVTFDDLVAFEPDATTAEVVSGNDLLASRPAGTALNTYSYFMQFSNTTDVAYILAAGAAAYLLFDVAAPPTTGEITIRVLRLS